MDEKMIEKDGRILKLKEEIKSRGYSVCTLKNYTRAVVDFRRHCMFKGMGLEPVEYVRSYILFLQGRGMEGAYINLSVAAIRFYYQAVLGVVLSIKDLPYLKTQKKIPVPFSKEEVSRIFSAKMNPKHLLLLAIYYGCGLRLSEVIGLTVGQVDRDRKTIYVRGKGKKDRFASIKDIPAYLFDLQCKGKGAADPLIESEQTGRAICKRTAQKVFEHACHAAGVSEPWNVHRLRHTFATHLLDGGTNIKYIQELLGHANSKTTEIYLHVSNQALMNVKSPIEGLIQKVV